MTNEKEAVELEMVKLSSSKPLDKKNSTEEHNGDLKGEVASAKSCPDTHLYPYDNLMC